MDFPLPIEPFDGRDRLTWNSPIAEMPASYNVWLTTPAADFLRGRFMYTNWDVNEMIAKMDEIVKNNELRLGVYGWDTCIF